MELRPLAAHAAVLLLLSACADAVAPRDATRSGTDVTAPAERPRASATEAGTSIGTRLAPGKCLTVNGAGETAYAGQLLVIWDCDGSQSQRWSVPAVGTTGEVRAYDMCMDAYGGAGNSGDPLVLWPCHGGANQQWTLTLAGEMRAFNVMCADVWRESSENGAGVRLGGCHGGANQLWDFSAPASPTSDAVAPVVLAAGDVANCSSTGDEETAALLDGMQGTVLALGDLAYGSGTATQFAQCYDPSWGRHKSRTRPALGNHDYYTDGASGYFGYFGGAGGEPGKGYYSYDLGSWHVVVLNSGRCREISCADTSEQVQWLRADLDAHPAPCTLAYWHHPRFNSGAHHGNYRPVQPFWDVLYAYGAEVILNGHEHAYERFAPQTPTAQPDPARGLRQFTVGTGGAELTAFSDVPKANSEVRLNSWLGVLRLELGAKGYRWAFVGTDGATHDAGEGSCH